MWYFLLTILLQGAEITPTVKVAGFPTEQICDTVRHSVRMVTPPLTGYVIGFCTLEPVTLPATPLPGPRAPR